MSLNSVICHFLVKQLLIAHHEGCWCHLVSWWVTSFMMPGSFIRLIMLFLVPWVLSLMIWQDFRMRVLARISGFLNQRIWSDLVTRWMTSFMVPSSLIWLIMFFYIPRMLSLMVWQDFRMWILTWISLYWLSHLRKGSWSHLITRGIVSLVFPCPLIRLIMFFHIPRMLSLMIWQDFWMRVFARVSLCGLHSLMERVWCHLVTRWMISFMFPCFLVWLIMLLFIPRVFSLVIWQDFRVRVLTWISYFLV